MNVHNLHMFFLSSFYAFDVVFVFVKLFMALLFFHISCVMTTLDFAKVESLTFLFFYCPFDFAFLFWTCL
jgi:hypothetical protein